MLGAMRGSGRVARHNARIVLGWVLLAAFVFMVAIWTAFGSAPELAEHAPEPFAAFGRVDGFWTILAGFVAGGGAAWALAPGLRVEGEETARGEGGVGLSPIAAALLGPSALLLMFASYWPCTGETNPFWGALRHATEALEGYVAEPFGQLEGCPAEFPQALLVGVLFGKITLALVLGIGLAFVFRRSLDTLRARWARQVIVFAGLSDETVGLARDLARGITERQTMLILDPGPGLARAREFAREISKTRHKAIALPMDVTDDDAIEDLMRKGSRKGIHGLYLLLPDASANVKAMDTFLRLHDEATGSVVDRTATTGVDDKVRPRAELQRQALLDSQDPQDRRLGRRLPDEPTPAQARSTPLWWRKLVVLLRPWPSEVPGRAVLRIDNPWHAEDWRRRQMLDRKGWLFDAISTHSTAARHAVHRMKFPPEGEPRIERVVLEGSTSFELAVLSELAFERAVDDALEAAARHGELSAAQTIRDFPEECADAEKRLELLTYWREHFPKTPTVMLVGEGATGAGSHFAQLLERYGVGSTAHAAHSTAEAREKLLDEHGTALILGEDSTEDPTLLAVPHPRWRIFAWSDEAQGVSERPLIGGLSLVGPTLEPVHPERDQHADRALPRVDDAAPAYGVDVWERLGRIEHKCYLLRNFGGLAKSDAEKPARGDWDEDLSDMQWEDNIRPFATLVRTLTDLGYIWANDLGEHGAQQPATLSDTEEEQAAINEHASWVRHRVEDAWAFGERADKRRVHNNIVGWQQLDTETQGYDYDGVSSALALFKTLGFVLARPQEAPGQVVRHHGIHTQHQSENP